jgi:hypothetical protein
LTLRAPASCAAFAQRFAPHDARQPLDARLRARAGSPDHVEPEHRHRNRVRLALDDPDVALVDVHEERHASVPLEREHLRLGGRPVAQHVHELAPLVTHGDRQPIAHEPDLERSERARAPALELVDRVERRLRAQQELGATLHVGLVGQGRVQRPRERLPVEVLARLELELAVAHEEVAHGDMHPVRDRFELAGRLLVAREQDAPVAPQRDRQRRVSIIVRGALRVPLPIVARDALKSSE